MTDEDDSTPRKNTPSAAESEEYFEHYWKYASTLRNWLIAYGVGGLAFVVQHQLLSNDSSRDMAFRAARAFLVATVLQVLLVYINKLTSFWNYQKVKREYTGEKTCRRHHWSQRIQSWFFIDVVVDFISLVSLAAASLYLAALLA